MYFLVYLMNDETMRKKNAPNTTPEDSFDGESSASVLPKVVLQEMLQLHWQALREAFSKDFPRKSRGPSKAIVVALHADHNAFFAMQELHDHLEERITQLPDAPLSAREWVQFCNDVSLLENESMRKVRVLDDKKKTAATALEGRFLFARQRISKQFGVGGDKNPTLGLQILFERHQRNDQSANLETAS